MYYSLSSRAVSAFAVSRIALVKPEKARGVEDILLNAAKRGQLGQKVRMKLKFPTYDFRPLSPFPLFG